MKTKTKDVDKLLLSHCKSLDNLLRFIEGNRNTLFKLVKKLNKRFEEIEKRLSKLEKKK